MKVLITGGAGFVGSWLSRGLTVLGHNVTILDNFSTGRIEFLKDAIENGAEAVEEDILNFRPGIDKYNVVFHLAAKPFSKATKDWFAESLPVFHTNATGTYNVLRRTNPSCHFILVSSASVYGEGRGLVETDPYNPLSAYGYSKTVAEQITVNSPRHCTIVRPGTIIGPRGRCFPNRLMWLIVHNEQCTFFKNGKVLRDIIDVRDIASALIKIMEQKLLGIYNLGTNTEIRGSQLSSKAKQVAKNNKLTFNFNMSHFAPEDFVVESTLNSNKLYAALNWKPRLNLLDSLETILNYYLHDHKATEPPSWDVL